MTSTSRPVSGSTITQRVVGGGLLLIALVALILPTLMYQQFKGSLQQQADALGEALLTQTVREIAPPLQENDHLALAAVLRELTENPYVAHAALYNVDSRTLAEAGQRPRQGALNSLYNRPVTFEHSMLAQLQLHLDVRRLQKPLKANLQLLALSGVGLLILAVLLLSRLGRSLSQPLTSLTHWLANPRGSVPHMNRADEIGQLARMLDQCFQPLTNNQATHSAPAVDNEPDDLPQLSESASVISTPEEQELTTSEPEELPEELPATPLHCAVLAVDLSLADPLYSLDESRQQALLQRHADALDDIARHAQAQQLQLADGTSLLLFHGDEGEPVEQAVCAAELLRALVHNLQMDIADSRITLGIQLGLALGEAVIDLSEQGLLDHPAVQQAVELSRYSRNLALLSEELAEHTHTRDCASIRRIAKPAGAHCIERLLPPYAQQLDDQLLGMLMQTEVDIS